MSRVSIVSSSSFYDAAYFLAARPASNIDHDQMVASAPLILVGFGPVRQHLNRTGPGAVTLVDGGGTGAPLSPPSELDERLFSNTQWQLQRGYRGPLVHL